MPAVICRALHEGSFGVPKILFLVSPFDRTGIIDEVRCIDDCAIIV
jgi:hypothetical protein